MLRARHSKSYKHLNIVSTHKCFFGICFSPVALAVSSLTHLADQVFASQLFASLANNWSSMKMTKNYYILYF